MKRLFLRWIRETQIELKDLSSAQVSVKFNKWLNDLYNTKLVRKPRGEKINQFMIKSWITKFRIGKLV
jgi:hypothetical protein